jgi:capsular polysaccharide transport system permease protein
MTAPAEKNQPELSHASLGEVSALPTANDTAASKADNDETPSAHDAARLAFKAARAARKAALREALSSLPEGGDSPATSAAARAAFKAARAARKAALRAERAALPPPEVPPPIEPQPLPELPQVPAGSSQAAAAAVRRARGRRLALRVLLFVLLPTVLATGYFGLIATAQYESYSLFTVQSSEARPTLGVEGLLAGITGGNAGHDALTVRDYVLSRDMLERLDKDLHFIDHYKASSSDWFSRLGSDASFEDAYKYYSGKVYADFDQTTGAVTLRVRAFSADKAIAISRSVLASSEEMVNKLSERQRHDRIAYAEADLRHAEERLTKARKAVVALQQKYGDFSPLQTAGAAMQIRTALEGELAKARAELMQLKSYMNDDAPQVRAANEKIKAISAQVAGESRRLVDPSKPNGLNASFADFEEAMMEKEFSEKVYQSSLASLELAREDANRQHRYLAVIAKPSKPDKSTYPHRVRGVAAAFFVCFLLLGVCSLMVAAVREHARL